MEKSEYIAWLKKVYFAHGQNWWLFGFKVGEVQYTNNIYTCFRKEWAQPYIDIKKIDRDDWKRISDKFVEELTNGLL